MENYKIIKDEQKSQEFINWLPDLEDGQKFYVCLMARKKYGATEGLKSDKSILKRFTATKEQLINKIKKLEVEVGSYEVDGLTINQDSLALYITPNPRDMHKAGLKTIQELTKYLVEDRTIYNPQSIALNMIQVTGVKIFFDVDIDIIPNKTLNLNELCNLLMDKNVINAGAIKNRIITTRGGFHILVELDKISTYYKKSWFNNFSQLKDDRFTVMMNSDGLVPLVGCAQSNFIPKLFL